MINVRIVDNQCSEFGEYSRSIERENGQSLDICAFRKERQIVIAIVDENDVHIEEIAFSSEELEVLKQHLSDPVTLAILGGKEEVRCPSCGEVVKDFNHPYCSGGK